MPDDPFAHLAPSTFFGCDAETDWIVRETLRRYHPVLEALGTDEYNLRRFRSAAFNFIPLLRSTGLDLASGTMLEIGCGRGLKGLAWGDLVGRYVGIDIDAEEIRRGRAIRAAAGRNGDELIQGHAGEVLAPGGTIGPEDIQILVLYAVLEHLTPRERSGILRFARQCYERGALVIIAETPNRLIRFDHHSSHKHFLQMLPDGLAARHLRKFTDHPIRRFIENVPAEAAEEMLYRSGRGLSFHDFELDFCDGPLDFGPAIDGYHPALIDLQPLSRSELELQQYVEDNSLRVPRGFSRGWLDLFLQKNVRTSPASVRLHTPATSPGIERIVGREAWNLDRFVGTERSVLTFEIPRAPRGRGWLLVDVQNPECAIEVRVGGEAALRATSRELHSMRPKTWHSQFVLPLELESDQNRVQVRTQKGSAPAMVHGILVDA